MTLNTARSGLLKPLLLGPGIVLVLLGVVLPIASALFSSFRVGGTWSVRNFQVVLTQEPYPQVLLTTLLISFVVCVLSIALAFPVCAYFANRGKVAGNVFIAITSVALATAMLVRTYAWQVILAYNGPLNDAILALGLADERQRMLFTRPAVMVAMVQFMTPYAALILFGAMRRVDQDLVTAARTLGGNAWVTFWSAYWPQISSSVLMAAVLVFAMSTGFFVAPALLGGPTDAMVGTQIHANLIFDHANGAGLATAQGVILAAILAVVSIVGFRVGGTGFLRAVAQEKNP